METYIFDHEVWISSTRPEHRRVEFSAPNDEEAIGVAKNTLREIVEEFPFAPPHVEGKLYSLRFVKAVTVKIRPVRPVESASGGSRAIG